MQLRAMNQKYHRIEQEKGTNTRRAQILAKNVGNNAR